MQHIMIIDLILNRKDFEQDYPGVTYADYIEWKNSKEGQELIKAAAKHGAFYPAPYCAKTFYNDVLGYGEIGEHITYAMNYFGENLVKRALCEYVINNEYNPAICDYINSVNWLIDA